MCGIVGTHTADKQGFFAADKDGLKQMMIINSIRGSHSTGFFGVDKNFDHKSKVNIVKSIGSPYMLYDWKECDTFFSRMIQDFGTVVGHGRYATMGKIDAETAHPFTEGHITLVHNGVINNFNMLHDRKKHDHITVDSHLIAHMISEEGAENVLPNVRGAFVFVWWDSVNGTLNITRNKERPLYITNLSKKDTIQFASESETLAWNADRNGIDIKSIDEVEPYKIYTYKAGEIIPKVTEWKEKYTVKSYGKQRWSYEDDYDDYQVQHSAQCTCPKCKPAPIAERTTNVIPIANKRKIKFRPVKSSVEDELILGYVVQAGRIKVGDTVIVEIQDYKPQHSVSMVTAYRNTLPMVEFTIVGSKNNSEHNLHTADYIEGRVSTIYGVDYDSTFDKQIYKAYLTNAFICFVDKKTKQVTKLPFQKTAEDVSDNDWVTLLDSGGEKKTIQRFRMLQLAKKGCAWCNNPISEEDCTNANELMLDFNATGDHSLICLDCSANALPFISMRSGYNG